MLHISLSKKCNVLRATYASYSYTQVQILGIALALMLLFARLLGHNCPFKLHVMLQN